MRQAADEFVPTTDTNDHEPSRLPQDAGSVEIRDFGKLLTVSGAGVALGSAAVAELANKPEYMALSLGGTCVALMGAGFYAYGRNE